MSWSISNDNLPAVVVPEDASEPVRFAAEELRKYLEEILGAALPDTSDATITICVKGDPELGDEGFELSFEKQDFRIIGGGRAGVVYGAYEFLRKYCGCQFSGLPPEGEYIPRVDNIEIQKRCFISKPKLWYRGMQFGSRTDVTLGITIKRIDWMAKNGLNYVMFSPRDEMSGEVETIDPATGDKMAGSRKVGYTNEAFMEKVWPEVQKRGLKLDRNHHNLRKFLLPEKYFDEHPEWFPLVNGKRIPDSMNLCICSSNADACKTVAENVKEYLRENPQVKLIGIIPEDGKGYCECPECQKLGGTPHDIYEQDKDPDLSKARDVDMEFSFRGKENEDFYNKWFEGQDYNLINRYAHLINQVAREVREGFPDVLIGMSAYYVMVAPPEKIKLEPNIVPWVALYWRCGCHAFGPGTCRSNQFYIDVLNKWKKVHKGKVIVYEYYMGMDNQRSLPYPMSEVLCRDWDELKKIGVEGATLQSTSTNHNIYGLNNLAFARCGWEDEVDHRKVLNDFLLGMFGSAADEIRPIYEMMLKAIKRIENEGPEISKYIRGTRRDGCLLPRPENINFFVQEKGFDFINECIEKALDKAKDKHERKQVENFMAAVRYWQMAAEVVDLQFQAQDAEKCGDTETAGSLYQQIVSKTKKIIEYIGLQPLNGWMRSDPVDMLKWRQKVLEEAQKKLAGLK